VAHALLHEESNFSSIVGIMNGLTLHPVERYVFSFLEGNRKGRGRGRGEEWNERGREG
jgi:hypothetical protein